MPRSRWKPEISISLTYFVAGLAWIMFSDILLFDFLASSVPVKTLSTLKGGMFVLVTALLLYFLLRKNFMAYRQQHRKREEVLAQLRLHIDGMPIGYVVTDRDFRFVYINPAAEKMFGYSDEELKGKTPYGRVIPATAMGYFEEIRRSWGTDDYEWHRKNRNIRKDGSIITCEWYNMPIFDGDGAFDHLISMVIDVTDLEEAIEALQQSEERYRLLTDDLPALVCEFLPDSTLTYVNRAYAKYFSLSPEDLIGRRFEDFLPEGTLEEVRARYMALTPDLPSHTYAHAVLRNGRRVVHQWTNRGYFDEHGRVIRLQGVGFDMTERIEMEKALKQREEDYRLLVENQTDLIVKIDRRGDFQFVSPSYCRLFGKTEDELLGKNFVPLVHEEDRTRTLEAMEALYRPPWTAKVEQRAMTRDGWRWLEWVDTAVLDEEGEVEAIIGVGRDITARRRAEEALRESEERYRILIERANDGILLLRDGVFVSCNQSAALMLSYSPDDIIGKRPEELSPPVQPDGKNSETKARELLSDLQGTGYKVFEWIHERSDGSPAIIEVSLSIVNLRGELMTLCFWRDVTVRRQAEQEVAESRRRLRALAERLDQVREEERLHLSREIHDGLGQLLTAMKIDLSFVKRLLRAKEEPQSKEEVAEIHDAVHSMESLLKQTIGQVRQIAWEMRPGMLEQLGLPDALRQYVRDLAERSNLELVEEIDDIEPHPNDRTVLALFRIVQEAMTNVLRHASARRVRILLVREAGNIRLEVADDGTGIGRNLETREDAAGTMVHPGGIGLSSMRERAELLGGEFSIGDSPDGKGTRIVVTVPAD